MRRLSLFLAFAALLFAPAFVCAQGVVVGGYDVAKIAGETVGLLAEKGAIDAAQAKAFAREAAALPAGDALLAAGPLVALYGKLFEGLVAQGVLAANDVAGAKRAAEAAGGLKAAGMNPLVFAAACLDLLSKKGIFSLEEAQQLLDAAKLSAKKPISLTNERTKG